MAMDHLTDGVRKLLLAGVGAVASTADKGQEIFDDLVKKGELTVEQGKVLNQELKHTVKEGVKKGSSEKKDEDASDKSSDSEKKEEKDGLSKEDLGKLVAGMTAEELEDLKAKIRETEEAVKTAAKEAKDGV